MVSDEELLTALKNVYLYVTEIASFQHALGAVLIRQKLMTNDEFVEALDAARKNMAEVREQIQSMTLRSAPDFPQGFEGPLQ